MEEKKDVGSTMQEVALMQIAERIAEKRGKGVDVVVKNYTLLAAAIRNNRPEK